MPVITVADGEVYCVRRGRGEPVVLLHGLASCAADWAFQVPDLQPRFEVLAPDLPGCGHSSALSHVSVERLAQRLWQALDVLGVVRPHLVGFSLGGAVALEMALQRPHEGSRLVLINSLPSYRIDHWRKWCEARLSVAAVRLLGMRRTGRLVARRLFPHPEQAPMARRVETVFAEASGATYHAMIGALQRWSARERLAGLRARTLVIAAEHDYTPLDEKRAFAAAVRAGFALVRGSRHGTPFDAVTATNATLLAHLQGLAPPDPSLLVCDRGAAARRVLPSDNIVEDHARRA